MKNPDELIMYIIVNQDLSMSIGKTAVQVGHAVADMLLVPMMAHRNSEDFINYKKWYTENNQKKLVFRAKEKKVKELADKFWGIHDLGLTEIPENSLTCACLGIMTRQEAEPYIKRLQLL